ncbi:GuaB3 family IMP dehydrogenase-related protein [Mycobacteroides abscessus]|uniref:GuaB3 family IMP dehydrogenase-related protein n=1 Tax=Mycobacteroides abscessus TaxID=36809 RepID=UPI0005DF838D|nr:GuaB3 family IMP dehydrogenase-related protein [Mycobacteroides abscessus]MBE5509172.1 IMP dehydrogenase [Mycobacteroides abscessus]MBN7386831.1 GuaB3 family IMP dehydrogenase-related protein [Mycobacteroides abscessus subsp. abscessus]MBN7416462.1 GuaB3 family IMP dehydrogenase-related protein [Mycobacteroides abscessus subsp. abscessus]MBN7484313.1 GuaB3 family IMP dehydrogenase-related protein [Mycobacteroides abscessus subsp. abscessus]MBN7499056.1 GuaB3 family IMP dehydrogenase-related
MRDLVEIGMGRTARRTYELDDVNIVPSRRTRSSQDVSTAWQLDAYRFEIPVVAHPTDALVSPHFAIELGKAGGLGVINGEGLWGRHADVEARIAEVVEVAQKEPEPSAAIRLLQQLHSAPIDPDLLAAAIAEVRGAGVTTAVRVSPQNAQLLTPHLIAAGIDLLVIHGTIVSAERVARDGEPLNLKTFISELDIPVVAGGVIDHRTALHLMRTGAAGVIVGYGQTAGATTSGEVLGVSVAMATAIADAAAARREYLDETGGRYVHVLADGDIHTSGDLAKSIACGADAVVLGTPLAAAQEAAGDGWFWPNAAAHPSLPRGALLQVAVGERPPLSEVLAGPSDDPFGTLNLVGGLRRSMAKSGYCDLKEFQKVGLTVNS